MELLDKYMEEIEKDLQVDDFNIKEVQQRLPARKHFWVGRLINAKRKRNALIDHKKNKKMEVVAAVIATTPVSITASLAASKAENHDDIRSINEDIRDIDYIIEYLERVEKILSGMSWDIKNIIELNKLEQL